MRQRVSSLRKLVRGKSLPKLTKRQRGNMQINKFTKEKVVITTDRENSETHHIILQKSVFQKIRKCKGYEQFAK